MRQWEAENKMRQKKFNLRQSSKKYHHKGEEVCRLSKVHRERERVKDIYNLFWFFFFFQTNINYMALGKYHMYDSNWCYHSGLNNFVPTINLFFFTFVQLLFFWTEIFSMEVTKHINGETQTIKACIIKVCNRIQV